MAITGIDTIDGKQIIAAGAVSAKSAEMAYNDENGNPITGYLTAVPAGTMNESAFGYDGDNKISSYNGSAFAGGSYQPSGNYIPYTAVDSIFNNFKTNSGLEITTSFGGTLNTNFINSNYINLRYINSKLDINNQSILSNGSLEFQIKSDSAYVDREKIHKWDSASDYIQNNSATINEVNTSYQTNSGTYLTAHQDLSDYQTTAGMTAYQSAGDYYSASNPSGFISEVPAGTMNESAFGYDASDNITAYNGSAFKAGDEFPQSATEAIETVTANSADWNGTTETVSSNSGAWGGSALPISAGNGVKISLVDNTLVFSNDETVLYSNLTGRPTSPGQYFDLSESPLNFEYIEVYLNGSTPSGSSNIANGYEKIPYIQMKTSNGLEFHKEFVGSVAGATSTVHDMGCGYSGTSGTRWAKWYGYSYNVANKTTDFNNNSHLNIWQVVGINRIAGGN